MSNLVLEQWQNLFPNSTKPRDIRYLGIPGSIEGRTTTFLAFTENQREPVFVVKIHRDSGDRDQVLNERDVLLELQSKGYPLSASVPRLILCEEIADRSVLVESVLEGRPMMAAMTSRGLPEVENAAANMSLAKQWLLRFNTATMQAQVSTSNWLEEYEAQQIRTFEATFELSRPERDYLREINAAIESPEFGDLDMVTLHGDFCRQNILVSQHGGETKLGVIDWTFSRPIGLPLHDLFFFMTTYFLQIRSSTGSASFTTAFEETFCDSNPYSHTVQRYVKEYCSELGISLSLVRPLFTLFLIERAVFEYLQLEKCARTGGLPRFSVYLAALENSDYREALKHQLWIGFFRNFVRQAHQFIL